MKNTSIGLILGFALGLIVPGIMLIFSISGAQPTDGNDEAVTEVQVKEPLLQRPQRPGPGLVASQPIRPKTDSPFCGLERE